MFLWLYPFFTIFSIRFAMALVMHQVLGHWINLPDIFLKFAKFYCSSTQHAGLQLFASLESLEVGEHDCL